jgi:hypothetical protein
LFIFLSAAPVPFGPLAATGRTLHDCRRHVKSIGRTPSDLRKRTPRHPLRSHPARVSRATVRPKVGG